ncbi:EamA family transporter [Desulfosarcina sp.]|uniref:EamA family transporter n=1 Tax=Desulfosarcina sp. TaxID=2027861 RepID=UPI003970FA75
MLNPETLAVTCGLCSALAWGAGDFAGGFASRRGNALTVVFFSQLLGGLLMLGLTPMLAEHAPDSRQVMAGMLAGAFGVLGLVGLYKGLGSGRMGLVAPLSAMVTAVIPMGFAFVVEGLPTAMQMGGLAVAMAAVWLLSSPGGELRIQKGELRLSLLAGLGFGLFFILMDHASGQAVLWPLLASKAGAVSVMVVVLTATRQLAPPPKNQVGFILLAGILDTTGTAAFTLAAHLGRLDISTVLASLYPASTIILAWIVFRERLGRRQWFGVAGACVALVLIAV